MGKKPQLTFLCKRRYDGTNNLMEFYWRGDRTKSFQYIYIDVPKVSRPLVPEHNALKLLLHSGPVDSMDYECVATSLCKQDNDRGKM